MKIIRDFHNIDKEAQNAVLTMGNFDGVHLGHQQILQNIRDISAQNKTKSALLTFEPHPFKILNHQKPWNIRIMSLAQKLDFLRKNNLVDMVFVVNFTKKLADLIAEDFVRQILVRQLKINHLLIGYDFVFGKNKGGNADLLEKLSAIYDFGFSKIQAFKDLDQNIFSSTNIRKSIISGDVKSAASMLGHNYQIQGIVVHGQKQGRILGFPTANLIPKTDLIKPRYGIYKAKVKISGDDKNYPAIVSFGVRPTIAENLGELFEAHIFNFNKEIYGQKITIELIDFIREEKKFASISELKTQMQQDCKNCYEAL